MTQSQRAWIWYALCLSLGVAVLVWISVTALRMERKQIETEQKASREEKVHTALWLMDTTFALFLNPESARPHYHYQALYQASAEGAANHSGATAGVRVYSPLLMGDDPLVRLRFQIDSEGRMTSPFVLSPPQRRAMKAIVSDSIRFDQSPERLAELKALVNRGHLVASLNRQGASLLTRELAHQILASPKVQKSDKGNATSESADHLVYQGAFTPVWYGSMLMMVRQVWVGDEDYLQGCWLDWPVLKETLLSTVRTLLPEADLCPAQEDSKCITSRQLVSLPVRLLPGKSELPPSSSSRLLPLLLLGWCGMLLMALLSAWLLHQSLKLSERRSAFVSTVSHELRTPLTTFSMYTEMLMFGMVPPEEMTSFLAKLRAESDRLDLLLKNVLAYARIEDRPSVANREDLELGAMLERMTPRLVQRAGQAGMALILEIPDELNTLRLRTDPAGIEQILFNVVDNACKYAGSAENRNIEIHAKREGKRLAILVRDHGPGIPSTHPRLFEPFSRPTSGTARSAPGVGLGLALCRRLARELGGNLELERSVKEGACFRLTLAVAVQEGPPGRAAAC